MARKLDGSKSIQSGTITSTQLSSSVTASIEAGGGPRISGLVYPDDDTAANTVGGQTVYLTGSGFDANAEVYINGSAVPSVSFISASNVGFTTPALSAATYPVYLINPDDGATAILVPGISISGEPTWVTGATLTEQDVTGAWNISLSATGDAPLTYALAAGSSLPGGITLASNGVISGTITAPPENNTTYNFTVNAIDAQNQSSSRAFSVTASAEGVLFANNVLLIHADGTNNQNNHTFLDSSNNNLTITRAGNATQGSFSPFSQTGWSAYFDGTGDNLLLPFSSEFNLPGDFTIECWIFPTVAGGMIINCGGGLNIAYASYELVWNGSAVNFAASSVNNAYDIGSETGGTGTIGTPTLNRWSHIAVTRSGNVYRGFLNGVQGYTQTLSLTPYNQTTRGLVIGGNYANTWGTGTPTAVVTGNISNVRIIKGTALYTSNFTPPTSPLTAIANTSLLTCQSNRFLDNSTNNFTITRSGDVSVQPFSPFAPTAAYSTANVGGSAYFDGTGDTLETPSITVGTNAFCFECWFYPGAAQGNNSGIFVADTNNGLQLSYYDATGTGGLGIAQKGVAWQIFNSNGIKPTVGQWNHIAFVRSGTGTNQTSIFLNGTRIANGTVSYDYAASLYEISTVNAAGTVLNGYMSGARFTLGSTPYDATQSIITVPTAPPTNIANTSLLLNFTNAGIFDQTAKNVLETVGDAKVSTSIYKYGAGSIAFDGTNDNITIPSSPNLDFGTGDFTIELWVNFSALSTSRVLLDKWVSGNANSWQLYWRSIGTSIAFLVGSSTILLQDPSTSRITTNTWYHIAVTRSGTTNRLFIDGTQVASATNSTNLTNTNRLCIGEQLSTLTNDLNGYIDDLRITKGYARYTANFTAPTSAFKNK